MKKIINIWRGNYHTCYVFIIDIGNKEIKKRKEMKKDDKKKEKIEQQQNITK